MVTSQLSCEPAHHPSAMVISSRVRSTFFAPAPSHPNHLVRLPLSVMPHYEPRYSDSDDGAPIVLRPLFRPNLWTSDEHERFLQGLEMFPHGPWKEIAKVVSTKTTRQTMTHAQKYRQKIERRLQGKVGMKRLVRESHRSERLAETDRPSDTRRARDPVASVRSQPVSRRPLSAVERLVRWRHARLRV